MLQKLAFKTLDEFDGGRLSVAFDQVLRRAVDDCRARPGLPAARKIVLEISLVPKIEPQTGECDGMSLAYQTATTIPPLQKKGISLGVQKNGDLLFNDFAMHDHRQGTLLPPTDASTDAAE